MSERWPWLLLIALGVYHGVNPAMGWLFAVGLGLHRRSRAVVLQSLVPIALGHLLAIASAAALVIALGLLIDTRIVRALAGGALIIWALYHALYGAIDGQFYPDGIKGWMVKLNTRPEGGMEFDRDFFLEWPAGHLPHQVRLQGGDASSDSYSYP